MKNKYKDKILNIYHYSDKYILGFSATDESHYLLEVYDSIPNLIYVSNFSRDKYQVCLNIGKLEFKSKNFGCIVGYTIPSYAIYEQLRECLRDWDVFL